jgi:serine/threonine protein kinase
MIDQQQGTDREFQIVAARLAAATSAEEIFGALPGAPDEQFERLHRVFRQLALVVHPDRHRNDPIANAAFVTLHRLYDTARAQVLSQCYGQASSAAAVTLTSRRRTYTVGDLFAEGEIANLYTCTVTDGRDTLSGLVKVARESQDNDLIANEASALRRLLAPVDNTPIPAYIPRLLETFVYRDAAGEARQVNAFPLVTTGSSTGMALQAGDFFTLEEVREQFPAGLDPKHMAWIWRRLLIALGHAHDREVIHGAVLPTHVLIHPADHGLLLVDWSASVQQPRLTGARIPTISEAYAAWYPPSVPAGLPPTPSVDIEMALRCMVELLGGDPLTGALPAAVPAPIQAYLGGALSTVAVQADAWRLYRDFSDLLAPLWGQRRFIPLTMPSRRRACHA